MKKTKLHFTLCHRLPERSFFWKGKQFPICARCTGIHLGYFSFPFFLFGLISLPFWWTVAFILPTYADGFIQAFSNYQSTNTKRFITGLMAGIGTMSLTCLIGAFIGKLIVTYLL